MDLFSDNLKNKAPLAERMRPRTLDEFIGQPQLIKKGSLLRRAIEIDRLGSCIFYGPPGTGKTTLASIVATTANANFKILNAVTSGVADAKKIIEEAKKELEMYGRRTYLMLDECHRWSKAQSDAVLEAIEKGYIIFIGSTTEVPYTSMTRAIVSRCRIFEFKPLTKEDIKQVILNALSDKERGFGNLKINLDDDALEHFILTSGGDARVALGNLEIAILSTPAVKNAIKITKNIAKECTTGRSVSIDTDMYYDMLSAFCKSLRGSDADAALYWSRRMNKAGIDPLVIARRLVAHASEDVGLANSNALVVSMSALNAIEKMGQPEGLIPLSHAIIYVCMSPKSNSVVVAMAKADEDVENTYTGPVPDHLKNYNYANEKRKKYKYPHDYGGYVDQQYLPDEIKDHVYYLPSTNGAEKSIVLPNNKTAVAPNKKTNK
ncbi:MAG: replication-associated recombination protein A [Clostridia bacterium]|nr:replication-associated recombination protein A [Clostridia bacterium]